jgi:hypothetical protein
MPLGAPFQSRGLTLSLHLLGEIETGFVIASTLTWIAAGLVIASDRVGGAWAPSTREGLAPLLVCGALSLLAMPGLAIAVQPAAERGASLAVADLIASQERWHGLGWLGLTQPLAWLAWVASTLTLRPAGQYGASLAWQLITLNWALLTTAAFLGGWQGPWASQFAWLGYLYTAAKVGALIALRAWAGARLPTGHPLRQLQTAWTVYMPAFLVNLLVTAGLAVLR